MKLTSPVAANSPKSFTKEIPENPNIHRPLEKDLTPQNLQAWVKKLEALVIFYDQVNPVGADFDISLSFAANISQGVNWTKTAGPTSGALMNANTPEATYSKPKIGGLYKFDANLFNSSKVGTQALLPLAGAEMLSWLYREAVDMHTWAPIFKKQVEADNYSVIPGRTKLNILKTWIKISAGVFDYILDPVNADGSAPCLAFKSERGSGGGELGALYSYVTVNGVVLHGSKVNNLLWGMFGTYWGYSTAELQFGANLNAWGRHLWSDNSASQSAIQLGAQMATVLDRFGVSSLLHIISDQDAWKPLVDPNSLIEEKLWPSSDQYDEKKSKLIRPGLPTIP